MPPLTARASSSADRFDGSARLIPPLTVLTSSAGPSHLSPVIRMSTPPLVVSPRMSPETSSSERPPLTVRRSMRPRTSRTDTPPLVAPTVSSALRGTSSSNDTDQPRSRHQPRSRDGPFRPDSAAGRDQLDLRRDLLCLGVAVGVDHDTRAHVHVRAIPATNRRRRRCRARRDRRRERCSASPRALRRHPSGGLHGTTLPGSWPKSRSRLR